MIFLRHTDSVYACVKYWKGLACTCVSAFITSEVSQDAGKRGRSITLKIIRPWMAGSGEQPTDQS